MLGIIDTGSSSKFETFSHDAYFRVAAFGGRMFGAYSSSWHLK